VVASEDEMVSIEVVHDMILAAVVVDSHCLCMPVVETSCTVVHTLACGDQKVHKILHSAHAVDKA